MSRNLEHALHGEAGYLSDRQKDFLARAFDRRFRDDVEGFVEFMTNEVAVPGDYNKSWSYIAEDTNSLKRGSNLHLLFQEVSQRP